MADKRREEQQERHVEAKRHEARAADPQFANFEKHSKGIGMKLLMKMGFKPGEGLGRVRGGRIGGGGGEGQTAAHGDGVQAWRGDREGRAGLVNGDPWGTGEMRPADPSQSFLVFPSRVMRQGSSLTIQCPPFPDRIRVALSSPLRCS